MDFNSSKLQDYLFSTSQKEENSALTFTPLGRLNFLSEVVYRHLFQWIVKKCNEAIKKITQKVSFSTCVIDTAGFEASAVNGFEQAFRNYVQDEIQQCFEMYTFKREEEIYSKELEWKHIDFGLDFPLASVDSSR